MTILVVLLFLFVGASTAAQEPSDAIAHPVEVRKCCKLEESLSKDGSVCSPGIPSSWTEDFNQMSQDRKVVFGLPLNWRLWQNTRPQCDDNFTVFIQRKFSFVGFDNGDMYVSELGKLLNASQYCIDNGVLMTCSVTPPGLVKVNRCCPERSLFSPKHKRCTSSEEEVVVDLPNGTYFVNNIPCKDVVVAGRFGDDMVVLKNGSLKTGTGTVLPRDGYCLTRLENDSKYLYFCGHNLIIEPNMAKLSSIQLSDVIPSSSYNAKF